MTNYRRPQTIELMQGSCGIITRCAGAGKRETHERPMYWFHNGLRPVPLCMACARRVAEDCRLAMPVGVRA